MIEGPKPSCITARDSFKNVGNCRKIMSNVHEEVVDLRLFTKISHLWIQFMKKCLKEYSSKKVKTKKVLFFLGKINNSFVYFYRMDHNIESIDQAQRAQMLTNGEDPSQTIPFFRQTSPIGKKICL